MQSWGAAPPPLARLNLIPPPRALTAWTTSNITAGSDTTAILLRTIIHSLLSHPATLSRLLSELDCVPSPPVGTSIAFKQAHSLPYLDACIKEAGRLHPPFGLPLERVVPPEGAIVCGQRFKGGTVIGMSAWVVHRDQAVFGEDAGVWRPERWLECDDEGRRRMEASLLTVRNPLHLSFCTKKKIRASFFHTLLAQRRIVLLFPHRFLFSLFP